MKEYILERVYLGDRTLGSLYDGDTVIAKTLELPWRDNERSVSCIPEGSYEVIKQPPKPTRNYTYFRVPDGQVSGRSSILIHIGNNPNHTEGCILVGGRFGNFHSDKPTLEDSTAKMTWLANNLPDKFLLTIKKKP